MQSLALVAIAWCPANLVPKRSKHPTQAAVSDYEKWPEAIESKDRGTERKIASRSVAPLGALVTAPSRLLYLPYLQAVPRRAVYQMQTSLALARTRLHHFW